MKKELIVIILSVILVAFVTYFSIIQTGKIIQEDIFINGIQKPEYNTYGIDIVNNEYYMGDRIINKGDRIIWKNYDEVKHTITSEDSNELNHWLEQWMLFYDKLYYLHSNKQILFICYENLCNENLAWDSIQSFIEIKNEIDFEFIESKKEITLPYEENLYRQCISLYQKLKYLN